MFLRFYLENMALLKAAGFEVRLVGGGYRDRADS
jgi:tRNA nucleotidyltransferase/poly(A) polymerase